MISTLIAGVLAFVILFRVITVLDGLHFGTRTMASWRFHGFAVAYILLAIAATIVVIGVVERTAGIEDWLFLISSVGLILCDRRRQAK